MWVCICTQWSCDRGDIHFFYSPWDLPCSRQKLKGLPASSSFRMANTSRQWERCFRHDTRATDCAVTNHHGIQGRVVLVRLTSVLRSQNKLAFVSSNEVLKTKKCLVQWHQGIVTKTETIFLMEKKGADWSIKIIINNNIFKNS